jgi:GNAT superfamily N-acetyltransferase
VTNTFDLEYRASAPADTDEVVALLHHVLGWPATDPPRAHYDWKHLQNPFGRSPAWVAVDRGRIVGLRIFLRWEFEHDGRVVRAVRAVDTATHPDYQSRGIFTKLTLAAVDGLVDEGVAFVFNTPNDKSGPGYLKMGWHELGRVPVRFRPRSLTALARIARSRTAADPLGMPCDAGVPVAEALSDDAAVARLLAQLPASSGLKTHRSAEYLRWRYGALPELRFRALMAGRSIDEGVVFFRVRRRGDARELDIADLLVPGNDARVARQLQRTALRDSRADYLLRVSLDAAPAHLGVPLPNQGPVLFWRPLASSERPELSSMRLTLGDVEMF